MPAITREQFGQAKELKRKKFPMEPWGLGPDDYLLIRALGARDLIDLQLTHGDKPDVEKVEVMADFIAKALIDDSGNQMYNGDGGKAIMAKSLSFIKTLFDCVVDVSGITVEDDGAGGVELPNSNPPSSS